MTTAPTAEQTALIRAMAESTTRPPRRFDGYNYFGENPEQMVEFFDARMR